MSTRTRPVSCSDFGDIYACLAPKSNSTLKCTWQCSTSSLIKLTDGNKGCGALTESDKYYDIISDLPKLSTLELYVCAATLALLLLYILMLFYSAIAIKASEGRANVVTANGQVVEGDAARVIAARDAIPMTKPNDLQQFGARSKTIKPTSLFLHLMFVTGLACFPLGPIVNRNNPDKAVCRLAGWFTEPWLIAGLVLSGVGYLAVVIRSCSCSISTETFLENIETDERLPQLVKHYRKVNPVVRFTIECYHYETETRIEYYTDSEGRMQQRQVSETKRVVTLNTSQDFAYRRCKDETGSVDTTLPFAFYKLDILQSIQPADQATRDALNAAEDSFVARHRNFDVHYDYERLVYIPGLPDKVLTVANEKLMPSHMSSRTYNVLTLLMMGYFYEAYLERISWRGTFRFVKRYSILL
ncbi:hypothetical protein HDU96_004460 [Phlyctochytrium bullatum]|nr:hypothetical protein HDU96_004460 [Phlyctochytrium bullatum]